MEARTPLNTRVVSLLAAVLLVTAVLPATVLAGFPGMAAGGSDDISTGTDADALMGVNDLNDGWVHILTVQDGVVNGGVVTETDTDADGLLTIEQEVWYLGAVGDYPSKFDLSNDVRFPHMGLAFSTASVLQDNCTDLDDPCDRVGEPSAFYSTGGAGLDIAYEDGSAVYEVPVADLAAALGNEDGNVDPFTVWSSLNYDPDETGGSADRADHPGTSACPEEGWKCPMSGGYINVMKNELFFAGFGTEDPETVSGEEASDTSIYGANDAVVAQGGPVDEALGHDGSASSGRVAELGYKGHIDRMAWIVSPTDSVNACNSAAESLQDDGSAFSMFLLCSASAAYAGLPVPSEYVDQYALVQNPVLDPGFQLAERGIYTTEDTADTNPAVDPREVPPTWRLNGDAISIADGQLEIAGEDSAATQWLYSGDPGHGTGFEDLTDGGGFYQGFGALILEEQGPTQVRLTYEDTSDNQVTLVWNLDASDGRQRLDLDNVDQVVDTPPTDLETFLDNAYAFYLNINSITGDEVQADNVRLDGVRYANPVVPGAGYAEFDARDTQPQIGGQFGLGDVDSAFQDVLAKQPIPMDLYAHDGYSVVILPVNYRNDVGDLVSGMPGATGDWTFWVGVIEYTPSGPELLDLGDVSEEQGTLTVYHADADDTGHENPDQVFFENHGLNTQETLAASGVFGPALADLYRAAGLTLADKEGYVVTVDDLTVDSATGLSANVRVPDAPWDYDEDAYWHGDFHAGGFLNGKKILTPTDALNDPLDSVGAPGDAKSALETLQDLGLLHNPGVAITETGGGDIQLPGRDVTFEVTVQNTNSYEAPYEVTIPTDTLDATCTASDGLDCATTRDIPAEDAITLDFEGTVPAGASFGDTFDVTVNATQANTERVTDEITVTTTAATPTLDVSVTEGRTTLANGASATHTFKLDYDTNVELVGSDSASPHTIEVDLAAKGFDGVEGLDTTHNVPTTLSLVSDSDQDYDLTVDGSSYDAATLASTLTATYTDFTDKLEDEASVTTTLVEPSLSISATIDEQEILPGEEATITYDVAFDAGAATPLDSSVDLTLGTLPAPFSIVSGEDPADLELGHEEKDDHKVVVTVDEFTDEKPTLQLTADLVGDDDTQDAATPSVSVEIPEVEVTPSQTEDHVFPEGSSTYTFDVTFGPGYDVAKTNFDDTLELSFNAPEGTWTFQDNLGTLDNNFELGETKTVTLTVSPNARGVPSQDATLTATLPGFGEFDVTDASTVTTDVYTPDDFAVQVVQEGSYGDGGYTDVWWDGPVQTVAGDRADGVTSRLEVRVLLYDRTEAAYLDIPHDLGVDGQVAVEHLTTGEENHQTLVEDDQPFPYIDLGTTGPFHHANMQFVGMLTNSVGDPVPQVQAVPGDDVLATTVYDSATSDADYTWALQHPGELVIEAKLDVAGLPLLGVYNELGAHLPVENVEQGTQHVPTSLTLVPDSGDSDGDGYNNLAELRGNSNPSFAESTPYTDDDLDGIVNNQDVVPFAGTKSSGQTPVEAFHEYLDDALTWGGLVREGVVVPYSPAVLSYQLDEGFLRVHVEGVFARDADADGNLDHPEGTSLASWVSTGPANEPGIRSGSVCGITENFHNRVNVTATGLDLAFSECTPGFFEGDGTGLTLTLDVDGDLKLAAFNPAGAPWNGVPTPPWQQG